MAQKVVLTAPKERAWHQPHRKPKPEPDARLVLCECGHQRRHHEAPEKGACRVEGCPCQGWFMDRRP